MRTRKATKPLIAKPRRHADRQTIVLISVAEWYCGKKIPEGCYPRDLACFNASHAARCVPCQGVPPHPVPVALMAECSHPGRVEGRAPALLVVPRHRSRSPAGAEA